MECLTHPPAFNFVESAWVAGVGQAAVRRRVRHLRREREGRRGGVLGGRAPGENEPPTPELKSSQGKIKEKMRVYEIGDPKRRHPVHKGVLVLYIVYTRAFWHYM